MVRVWVLLVIVNTVVYLTASHTPLSLPPLSSLIRRTCTRTHVYTHTHAHTHTHTYTHTHTHTHTYLFLQLLRWACLTIFWVLMKKGALFLSVPKCMLWQREMSLLTLNYWVTLLLVRSTQLSSHFLHHYFSPSLPPSLLSSFLPTFPSSPSPFASCSLHPVPTIHSSSHTVFITFHHVDSHSSSV